MKKLVILFCIYTLCCMMLFSLDAKSFPDVGVLYEYGEAHSLLYIKDKTSFELLSWRKDRDYPVLQTYTWDWEHLMLSHATWEYTGPVETLEPGCAIKAVSTADFNSHVYVTDGEALMQDGIEKNSYKLKFSRIPTINYGIDNGISLAWILREHLDEFLSGKRKTLEVGFINGSYYVDASLSYKGEELVSVPFGQVPCYKFECESKGLLARMFGKKAWVWLSKEAPHYMVRYRNENDRGQYNPFLDYQLEKKKSMSVAEWEALKKEKIAAAAARN